MIWWAAAAMATEPAWTGTWALDPSQSDDARNRIEYSVRAPILAETSGSQTAEGRQGDLEDERRKVIAVVFGMLSRTGQFTLSGQDDKVEVTFSGESMLELTPGRRWVKQKDEDGTRRIRAYTDGGLLLQRRAKNITLTETFLPLEADGDLPVVVRVDGSGLEGLEFRRVYRRIGD